MNQRHIVPLSFLLLTATLGLKEASADIPPPPGYVEQCTLAKQQVGGKSCVSCAANYSSVQKCKNEYEIQGYSKACKTAGASVWTEIWCTNGPAVQDPDPTDDDYFSCSVSGRQRGGIIGIVLGLVALGGLGIRRRRTSAR